MAAGILSTDETTAPLTDGMQCVERSAGPGEHAEDVDGEGLGQLGLAWHLGGRKK